VTSLSRCSSSTPGERAASADTGRRHVTPRHRSPPLTTFLPSSGLPRRRLVIVAEVGDHVQVRSQKGAPRTGIVTGVSGAMLTVRWTTGEESSLMPGPGALSVLGRAAHPKAPRRAAPSRGRTPTKKATVKIGVGAKAGAAKRPVKTTRANKAAPPKSPVKKAAAKKAAPAKKTIAKIAAKKAAPAKKTVAKVAAKKVVAKKATKRR
jgi:hypothetical protein